MTKAYLNRQEAMEYTKYGSTTLKKWAAQGHVRIRKDKRRTYYRTEDLDQMLLSQVGKMKVGNPGQRTDDQSAGIDVSELAPPAWLSAKGAENFRILAEQLRSYQGHLHPANMHGLAMCAKYLTEFQICEEKIIEAGQKDPENGGFVTVDKNKLVRIHPLTRYQRQCAELFFEYSARYGLTPSDREKLKLTAKEAAKEDKRESVR